VVNVRLLVSQLARLLAQLLIRSAKDKIITANRTVVFTLATVH